MKNIENNISKDYMEVEIWKDVIIDKEDKNRYKGLYLVSNYGNIKSIDRCDNIGRFVKGTMLRPAINNEGYLRVSLSKEGKSASFLVHRLVALAFLDNYLNLPEINHIDGNPNNNRLDNLEWCDAEYNCKQELHIKRLSKAFSGEKNPMSGVSPKDRMTEEQYLIWRENQSKSKIGSKNPNYNNDTLKKKLEKNPELKVKYYSRPASQNGRAKKLYIYNVEDNTYKEFSYIGEGCEWLINTHKLTCKIDSLRERIRIYLKNNKLFLGKYKFSYEKID